MVPSRTISYFQSEKEERAQVQRLECLGSTVEASVAGLSPAMVVGKGL